MNDAPRDTRSRFPYSACQKATVLTAHLKQS